MTGRDHPHLKVALNRQLPSSMCRQCKLKYCNVVYSLMS